MNAKEFVQELKEHQPTMEQLTQRGWPQSMWEELRFAYDCRRRATPLDITSSDPVVDLIRFYDVSKLEIGFIRFLDVPRRFRSQNLGEVVIFAALDTDYLGTQVSSGSVLFLDGTRIEYVMAIVAQNGSRFLDALIELIDATGQRVDPLKTARRCAQLAGCEDSIGFYEMLAG